MDSVKCTLETLMVLESSKRYFSSCHLVLFFVQRLSFPSSCCACWTLERFALREFRKLSVLMEKRAWVFTLIFQKFSWKFQSSLINDDASQTGVVCIMSRWQAALSHTHPKNFLRSSIDELLQSSLVLHRSRLKLKIIISSFVLNWVR